MLFVPAWVWHGGAAFRACCVGVPVGMFLAALGFAESGLLPGALIVFVVTGILNGVLVARRMGRAWPAATDLSPGDRVAVSGAVRRGRRIDDVRLAPAAIEYVAALHNASAQARRWRLLVWFGGAALLVLAVLDTRYGMPRTAAVSWVLVVLGGLEIFGSPWARDRLLANAERAGESARQALSLDNPADN